MILMLYDAMTLNDDDDAREVLRLHSFYGDQATHPF